MLKSVRAKIIQDELFELYRQSSHAWQWADAGEAHKRWAGKVDERISYLEEKLARLLDNNKVSPV